MGSAFVRIAALAAVGASAFLAGCSGDAPGTPDASKITVSAAPGDIVLPIDAYGFSMEQVDLLSDARSILIGDCLRRFGFPVDSAKAAGGGNSSRVQAETFGAYGNKRRYGIMESGAATKFGYHTPPDTSPQQERNVSKAQADIYGSGPMTPAKLLVLNGLKKGQQKETVNGQEIPANGCTGEANQKLSGTQWVGQDDLIFKIRADSYNQSMTDPAVVAAFRAWSACMQAKGYQVSEPGNAGTEFADTPRASREELTMAVTDVTCKETTKLVDVWHGTEVRIQQDLIEKHSAELQAITKSNDAQLRRISDVLSGK